MLIDRIYYDILHMLMNKDQPVLQKITVRSDATLGNLKITKTADEFQLRNKNLDDNVNNSCLVQFADGETTIATSENKVLNFNQGILTRGKIELGGSWTIQTPMNCISGVSTPSATLTPTLGVITTHVRSVEDLTFQCGTGGSISFGPVDRSPQFTMSRNGRFTFYNHVTLNAGVSIIGTFTNSSDERLKINNQPLSGALETIRQIKPQSYLKLKEETDLDGSFNVGVIAQELYQIPQLQFAVKVPDEPTRMEDNFVKETVQETVTEYEEVTETITGEDLSGNITTREVVTQNPVEVTRDVVKEVNKPREVTNYWSVDYNALSVYNIAAVKELDSNVKELSALVLSQASQIESLLARITELEAK